MMLNKNHKTSEIFRYLIEKNQITRNNRLGFKNHKNLFFEKIISEHFMFTDDNNKIYKYPMAFLNNMMLTTIDDMDINRYLKTFK